ncbi:glycoside hydrolase family 13 protein [Pedobacter miscanthi]|uniref:glycoside hydrolase family 13 protein n=1 Tax=Pedobacter miscanthi TaxID=2259170 RepID=UPI002930691A|nr:glycoside hydrolase family 13 protein [Pedobacter miscanthi]
MKKALLSIFFLITIFLKSHAEEIERIEPAFWWAGMKNPELQIMLYGKDISKNKLSLSYPGVKLKRVAKVQNPNYLFVYLEITPMAKPGNIWLSFIQGNKKFRRSYPLLQRKKQNGAAGFSSRDVMYLITPDRFANGNTDNDVLDGLQTDRLQPNARHGGDLQGIEKKLDYIAYLGFTTVWLNPVQENRMPGGSYHGYAITDFYNVDPRLGTNNQYRSLIEKAHFRKMKVVMDMIFNHCGSMHWWMKDLPTKDWLNNSGKFVQTNHYKWTIMDNHAPQSEKNVLINGWFSRGMPDLNQRNPYLAKYLIQNSIWWIEYSQIDGIRMDTYPYADYSFMTEWCKQVEKEYPAFSIVGESWYPKESASAWWQQNSPLNPKNSMLKTVMDFPLTFIMQTAFDEQTDSEEGKEAGLFKIYESLSQDFMFHDPDNMLTFLDNHDMGRFIRKDEKDLKRYKQALAFLLTTRGIPQIYYGTEILMSGTKDEGDGLIRKDFPGGWAKDSINSFGEKGRTSIQNDAWNYMRKLLQWRKTNPAVTGGRLIHYTPDQSGVYVYARKKGDHIVLVMLNGTSVDKTLKMDRFAEITGNYPHGKDLLSGETLDISKDVNVPSRGTYILELSE